jgi:outer membrane protein TolC
MKVRKPQTHKKIFSFAANIRISVNFLFVGIFLITTLNVSAQNNIDSTGVDSALTLPQCIDYALKHQPALQQSLINEKIAKATNAINQSGLYPQINGTANLTHYFQLPTGITTVNGVATSINTGIANTAVPSVGVTQALFNPELIYAIKTAPLYLKAAQQITDSTKIGLVADVSKSFYNLLLTLQQINVLKEDTIRLAQNVRDSYHQYVGGIVDETDYEEATITLNNSMAELKQANENIVPQYASLKQLMGYPPQKQFNIIYDSAQMMNDINLDTTEQLSYEKRIEYKQLATAKALQQQLTGYYHLAALPTVSAFYDYDYEFENSQFSKLFNNAYPYSLIGLTVSVPIFNGFYRVKNMQRSKLQENLLDWSVVNLKSEIYSEYTSALANYKSNLYNLEVLKNNVALAKRVYFVVTLQYKQGIVAYLNVITAESNLITSEIGYLNVLFQLLSSKIDLEKAMGNIPY